MKNIRFTPSIFLLTVSLIFLTACQAQQQEPIEPGGNRIEDYSVQIEGKRIGLMVNQASVINHKNLVDTLLALNINIAKIFTPEHGFRGNTDAGASVTDESYSEKGIPVISLYGNKHKPANEDLAAIDIMIFDLQDVGVRFYTYISSLHYIMEACARKGIPLLVLDRPNPNGHYIDGPVLKDEFRSFVGMHPVPIVYGMTIGEYAQMINGEYWLPDSIQCDLEVIRCKNYSHTAFYSLPVAPSPNLKNMASIYLYPSTCLFEGTVVSEGRGTEAPFQLIGHPDYSDQHLSFIPKTIVGASMDPKFKGELCYGVDLRSIPLDSLRSWNSIRLEYLIDFYNDLQLGEDFFTDYFNLLAGTDTFREQIIKGLGSEEIQRSWKGELEGFKKIRAKYLLYPDFESE